MFLAGRDPALGVAAYVDLICTPYPRPINQGEMEEEARLEGWDLSDDLPVSFRAHLPGVYPELYGLRAGMICGHERRNLIQVVFLCFSVNCDAAVLSTTLL